MYTLHINAGTEKMANLLNFLSAEPGRLIKEWPETIGLTEVLNANICDEDWGWFLEDLENAKITRLGANQFIASMNNISVGTPGVIEALMRTNNRLGHAHIDLGVYETVGEKLYPVSAAYLPIPFTANDNKAIVATIEPAA